MCAASGNAVPVGAAELTAARYCQSCAWARQGCSGDNHGSEDVPLALAPGAGVELPAAGDWGTGAQHWLRSCCHPPCMEKCLLEPLLMGLLALPLSFSRDLYQSLNPPLVNAFKRKFSLPFPEILSLQHTGGLSHVKVDICPIFF